MADNRLIKMVASEMLAMRGKGGWLKDLESV